MNQLTETNSQTTEFEKLLSDSLAASNLKEGSIIKGVISDIEEDVVVVDIGAKTEGRISKREFIFLKDKKELEVGDEIDVYLDKIENHNGECILSRSKAKNREIWGEIEKSFEAGELVEGIITGKVKGGLSCEIGITAFLPGSQIDTRPVRDISHLLNVPQKFKILKMDQKRNNIVVSRRSVLEELHKETREERFNQLTLGETVSGSVKAITDYGAFIDLGGYDSLLHSSDITHKRIGHPSEVLKIGEQLQLKIIKVDPEKNRVSVSLKALQDDPWESVKDKFNVGDKVSGTVTNVTDYGVFIEIEDGVEGLAHRDSLSYSAKQNQKPGNLFARSQSVEVLILEIDHEKRRLSLGIKQLTESPWIKFNETNPIGTIIDTEVTAIKDGIIFCTLGEEIDGAIFAKEISWEKYGTDAKEEVKKYSVGDKIKAKIITNDDEKVSLSIREAEGNPFDEIKDKQKGDIITSTVIETNDYGIKIRVGGDKGPTATIKKNDIAIQKADARPERFAKNDRVDVMITQIDVESLKISVSIRALEENQEKIALEKYGNRDSGQSLGDILGKAISDKKSEE